MPPGFEEKQYEFAMNLELCRGRPQALPPGQVLEAMLGYDMALVPANGNIWTLLGAVAPIGLNLNPSHWLGNPADRKVPMDAKFPTKFVSLILQYKVAHYLTGRRTKQWLTYWHRPYYRFSVDKPKYQRDVLMVLEANVRRAALVRYGAPAFIGFSNLWRHYIGRNVLENSAFVSPSSVGPPHTVWTYRASGTTGWANPEGERTPAERWPDLVGNLERAAKEETLLEHVRRLASDIPADLGWKRGARDEGSEDPRPAWEHNLRRAYPNIRDETVQAVLDVFSIVWSLRSASCTWMIMVDAR